MRIEALQLTPVKSSAATHFAAPEPAVVKSFGQYLGEALQNVNDLQLQGAKANIDLAAGRIDDISQVVVATEKAGIALKLTMQVRNKALDAYQEIMRMQV